ncbi:MAG: hypothetical protein E7651_05535 [Ruminococcaceae bacterium]|nr:hypothetical protein [Oscillospiraceae bacterium]
MVKLHKEIFDENCIFARHFRFLAFSEWKRGGISHGSQGSFRSAAPGILQEAAYLLPPLPRQKSGDIPCFLTQYTKP